MKKLVFRGAGVAIVTPFTAEKINFSEFRRMIDHQIDNYQIGRASCRERV